MAEMAVGVATEAMEHRVPKVEMVAIQWEEVGMVDVVGMVGMAGRAALEEGVEAE